MTRICSVWTDLRACRRRAIAVELICLLPALTLVLAAAVGWGGFFWLQHRVQAAADGALAAALSARDEDQRPERARAAAERSLGAPVFDLVLERHAGRPAVRIAYDASGSPVFALSGLTPLPSPMIVRVSSGEGRNPS